MAKSFTTINNETLLSTTASIHFVREDGVYGGPYIQITFESGIIHRYVLDIVEMNEAFMWADDYFYTQAQDWHIGKYSIKGKDMEYQYDIFAPIEGEDEGGAYYYDWTYRYSMGIGYMWDVWVYSEVRGVHRGPDMPVADLTLRDGEEYSVGNWRPGSDYNHGGKGMPAHFPVPAVRRCQWCNSSGMYCEYNGTGEWCPDFCFV